MDGERLHPKSWSSNTPLGGLRERLLHSWDTSTGSTRLEEADTADHEVTLRPTEAWTDVRHAEDDKYVELDYELAVALANATEGAARSTVLKVTEVEPSHGFVARLALVDGCGVECAVC